MDATDWIRLGIVMAGAGSLGAAVIVLIIYFIGWWKAPAEQRRLAAHIWGVALWSINNGVIVIVSIFGRMNDGRPVAGYAWAFGVSSVVGIVALVLVALEQIDRLSIRRDGDDLAARRGDP